MLALEEPIAASSIVPMYFVCQRARQDVKVALVGQGPDELFGGYRRHLGVRYGELWARLPSWMRTPISSTVAALPRNETLKRGVYSLAIPDRMRRYQNVLSLLPEGQVEGLFQDGLLAAELRGHHSGLLGETCTNLMGGTDELGGLQFLEVRSTLPDELLMYADKLSMAHGLELRVPFVDKEIVEYVERLPANLKVRNGSRKWLHRQVCRSLLPESILKRPKRGFAVNVVDELVPRRHRQQDGRYSPVTAVRRSINTFARLPCANSSSSMPPAGRTITKFCLALSFLRNGSGCTKNLLRR